MARIVTVTVGDESHEINLDEALRINNADAERHEVAADVAWWGVIAAAAAAQVERLTAASDSTRSKALVGCLAEDEKVSEWKAKAMATATDDYLALQNAIADAKEQADKANNIHWTLIRKSDMLREMIRGESGDQRSSHNIGRPGPVTGPAQVPDPKDRLQAFRANRSKPKED